MSRVEIAEGRSSSDLVLDMSFKVCATEAEVLPIVFMDIFDVVDFVVSISFTLLGWELAIPRISRGTRARFLVPPAMAYGSTGRLPKIPPDAALEFEVQLIDYFDPEGALKNPMAPVTWTPIRTHDPFLCASMMSVCRAVELTPREVLDQ